MAELAGDELSRTFIHQLEHGVSRPSGQVLKLIASRTGKPVKYFTAVGSDERLTKQALASDLSRLAGRLKRFRDTSSLGAAQKHSLQLIEATLRHGVVVLRNI